MSFEESLPLGEALQTFGAGDKMRRLLLCEKMKRSPTSSATQNLITNSSKYGITTGSHASEWISLTEDGAIATDPNGPPNQKIAARFRLAIEHIDAFKALYEDYKGKRLPTHDVIIDRLGELQPMVVDGKECVDIFIVNAKFLGLLKTIGGSETLVSVDYVLDELPRTPLLGAAGNVSRPPAVSLSVPPGLARSWEMTCFYVTAIGSDDSEQRQHSDMFLNALIEPALKDMGLQVVRADKIEKGGMITAQVIQHLLRARLVIVDLSWHNPNVFYEMAIRHATHLPVVQISRRSDPLPFDVAQGRTVLIDTDNKYTLVAQLETYRSQITMMVRAALSDDKSVPMNPLSAFAPGLAITVPKEG
jgi:hypothetical protein